MKKITAFTAMAVMILMTMLSGCTKPAPGNGNNPIGAQPNDPRASEMTVSWTYDTPGSLKWESGDLTPIKDSDDGLWKMLYDPAGVSPTAITPGFPPGYVAIGGDAINPTCNNPYNPACRTDISSNCTNGVCTASVNLPIGSWNGIWFWYDGQVRVDHITLSAGTQSWPLVNYSVIAGDTAPTTNPLHQSWVAACVRIDRPTPTTIDVNRDVANNARCQEVIYNIEIWANGDSSVNVLDDKFVPWNGLQAHEGDMKIKSTLLPPTVQSGSTLFPRIVWNTNAYIHRISSVAASSSWWLAFYSHDRGDTAPPNLLSPIHGGVSIRTYRYGAGWAIPTTPNCTTELQNMINLNTINPLLEPFYVLQVTGINTTSNCVTQGVDTRSQIFGFAN
ncbi:MAG: hypothetical protein NTZ49_04425 [Candidatus Parcubacteria bacterium]|nr:hypothetical protein [Candidatus Parcubacteria bacterium]